jgi:hypothetical protein
MKEDGNIVHVVYIEKYPHIKLSSCKLPSSPHPKVRGSQHFGHKVHKNL